MQMVLATSVLHEEAILQVAYKNNIKQPAYFFFVVVVFFFLIIAWYTREKEKTWQGGTLKGKRSLAMFYNLQAVRQFRSD